MTEKTYDTDDARDLPYRFTFSPITEEVFIIGFSMMDMGVIGKFENRPAFHRFLVEGIKTDLLIADKVIRESEEILRDKGGGLK